MIDVPSVPIFNFLASDHLRKQFDDLYPKTHTGTVLVLAARIEKSLEALLVLEMLPLSKSLRNKIFEGPKSALGTFSAKIEVARGLHLISAHEYQALNAIRDIRNKFAHSDDELHFDSEDDDLAERFARLPGSSKKTRQRAFLDNVIDMSKSLFETHDRKSLAKMLLAETPPASPEKSASQSGKKSVPAQDQKPKDMPPPPRSSPGSPPKRRNRPGARERRAKKARK